MTNIILILNLMEQDFCKQFFLLHVRQINISKMALRKNLEVLFKVQYYYFCDNLSLKVGDSKY